jgi:hypothetical protein
VSYVLDLFLLKEALVVDPVMISTSGDILAGPSVLAGFRYDFLNLNYAASVWHKSIFRLFLQSSLFEILWLCNLMHSFFTWFLSIGFIVLHRKILHFYFHPYLYNTG